ncbi:MAG TPA: two-component regulator propeller domain-containing protein [Draconibacterium sp.]|nr:two-component regulator propeller domain-containing protein [Draconibacterium sp.]
MRIFTFLISILLFLQLPALAQLGSWKDYLSYSNGIKTVVDGSKVFCATEGGLFYYDTDDNSTNKISGLSDFGIKTLAHSAELDLLIIAYTNSNLDIIRGGEVINLSDIKRKTLTADKSIYNVVINGHEAFIACGFGIVVLNLDRNEIKDTYFIGDGGSPLAVYDVDFYNQNIYAATEDGILYAPDSGVNLLDYTNWSKDELVPHAGEKFTELEMHAGKLVAVYTPGETNNDESFIWDGNSWTGFYASMRNVEELASNGDYLTFTGSHEIVIFNTGFSQAGKISSYQFEGETVSYIYAKSTAISNDGTIWIADHQKALVHYDGNNFESSFPDGPVDNEVFFLTNSSSALWVAPGGRTSGWNNSFLPPYFKRFKDGRWTNFSSKEIPELTGFQDIVCIAVDPADENHIFVGSWGGGVLEFRNDEFVERYTNFNSPLQTELPQQPNEPYVRIGGLDFDSEGNLWITNTATAEKNIHKLSPSGDWKSFTMSQAVGKKIGPLVVSDNDDKWVLIPRGNDAYVVDKTGDRIRKLNVTSYFTNGTEEYTTRMSDVYSIAKDQQGAIWIGTSQGVAVYNNPERIWEVEVFYASQPGLDLNDGIYHPLLSTETVTAIAIDGANRKWLGTNGSGVFLVSESGDKEIEHFTAENSPLLSNTIRSISVNEKSGEVFFGTDKGLISYQGDASGGKNDYSEVYVYPNPVRETYDGPVTITGLIAESDVKITDIGGNLVFKTTSLGGQAVWDGRNQNGKRVKTGVYLVFCNDKYGNQTHITKLLFIH